MANGNQVQFRTNIHEDRSETYDLVIWQGGKFVEVNCTSMKQAKEVQDHLIACGFTYLNDITHRY